MKATKRVIYTLELTEEEADWLRTVVQNPFGDLESVEDTEMRASIFRALSNEELHDD